MKVLVTGGAGYIGSHTVLELCSAGHEVVVFDDLSTGVSGAVLPPARLVEGRLADKQLLEALLLQESFDAIIHFAASIVVPESMSKPLKYYTNNTVNTIGLVDLAVRHGINRFVFSSTAAVYGMPDRVPIRESAPLNPINPYGRSKLMSEQVIQDASLAHPEFRHCILRYFNVAGADPEGRLGQNTPRATHLVKLATQTALGCRDCLTIFGTDYPTPDGTCIRDYIHVSDLARVHVLALDHLSRGTPSCVFNCGYGHGYSVREVVAAVQRVSGKSFCVVEGDRRPGDPPALVADITDFSSTFGWRPHYDDIDTIVRTALEWERSIIDGTNKPKE